MVIDREEIFKSHELITVEPWESKTGRGEYIFKRPNTNMYSIHIIFRPNTIIVYGDTQPNVIFRQGGIDLPWLNGAVNDPNYMFQKATQSLREYDAYATLKYAHELLLCDENMTEAEALKILNDVDWVFEHQAVDFFEEHFKDATPEYTYANCTVLAKGLEMFSKAVRKEA